MRERIGALPPVTRTTAVLMLAVPLVLWLFVVWDTRPYSPAEIAADRAAAESDPGFARTLAECESLSYPIHSWTGNSFVTNYPSAGLCRGQALDAHSSLTREPLPVDEPWGAGTWGLLSTAAAVLLVGARWQPAPGARAFLRRAGRVLVLGVVVGFVVHGAWWGALEWIGARRGMYGGGLPLDLVGKTAVLTALCGVVGLSAASLLRGPVRAVATLSTAAVAVGVVVLLVHPIDPWLPMLNVEAFLGGGTEYGQTPREVSCASLYGSSISDSESAVCTDRYATRTFGAAALYLFGLTGVLVAAAASTSVRRRGAPHPA